MLRSRKLLVICRKMNLSLRRMRLQVRILPKKSLLLRSRLAGMSGLRTILKRSVQARKTVKRKRRRAVLAVFWR